MPNALRPSSSTATAQRGGGAPVRRKVRRDVHRFGAEFAARQADYSTRTSTRACPPGHGCSAGRAFPCPFGSYCVGGQIYSCPAGTLGNNNSLATPACNGPCPLFHFCGNGSRAATPCPDGTFGNVTGLRSGDECSPCPPGYWCNSGKAFPCDKSYYTLNDRPSKTSTDLSACHLCPLPLDHPTEASATIGACVCDSTYYFDHYGNNSNGTCMPCPTGSGPCPAGTTLETLPVKDRYWRASYLSNVSKPCPHRSTCANGSMPNARYDRAVDATCTPGRGLTGVYCLLCAESDAYFDANLTLEACRPCSDEAAQLLAFLGIAAFVLIALALAARARLLSRMGFAVEWHRLTIAARQISLQTKVKITISFYQIVTQLDRVYAIVYPL